MILYNLICGHDHEFEAWFRNGAAYETQAAAGDIACPMCGDLSVRKAPMAPSLASRSISANALAAELRSCLTALRQQVEKNCDYVGHHFPDEARRIHYGESKQRSIYGDATPDEARALKEEGVEFVAIPWLPRQN
jgi:hypothetical protein